MIQIKNLNSQTISKVKVKFSHVRNYLATRAFRKIGLMTPVVVFLAKDADE
jgi:hypothetical protein